MTVNKTYQWTNLVFQMFSEDEFVSPLLDIFAYEYSDGQGCTIHIHITDRINDCPDYVYREAFFGCYIRGNTEYRDFFDENGNVYAQLKDDGNGKELSILKGHERTTYFSLLNCLALDKTMNDYGRLLLHSSFIETPQGAILFTAPSGTGKSTQADLWNQYKGTVIINGDRSGVWKENGIWMAGGVPWCGTSGICINRSMPLKAVVILRQDKQNELVDVRVSEKFKALMEQTTINPWNKEMYINAQNLLLDLCQNVPVYWLSCLPDREAVEILAKELGV